MSIQNKNNTNKYSDIFNIYAKTDNMASTSNTVRKNDTTVSNQIDNEYNRLINNALGYYESTSQGFSPLKGYDETYISNEILFGFRRSAVRTICRNLFLNEKMENCTSQNPTLIAAARETAAKEFRDKFLENYLPDKKFWTHLKLTRPRVDSKNRRILRKCK